MRAHTRSWSRLLAAALLATAAACTDRPTEPRHARPARLLDEDGNLLLVVGSTVPDIAMFQVEAVSMDGGEPRGWELKPERAEDDAESWGVVALAAGMKYEVTVRGFDADGRERFAGKLGVVLEEDVIRQVRAPVERIADEQEVAPSDPADEIYLGSYRVGLQPLDEGYRWLLWAHDATGERLSLSPEDVSPVPMPDPEIGDYYVKYGDEVLRQLLIEWREKVPPEEDTLRPPPPVTFCVFADVACRGAHTKWQKPPSAPPPNLYVKVVAAAFHTCALRSTGLARCWGSDGDAVQAGRYTNTLAAHDLVDIDTDSTHSCAIDRAGAAWCWGSDDQGQQGTAGQTFPPTSTPQLVSGGRSYTRIATGRYHSCAIETTGAVWCWGLNDAGQLGDGAGGRYLAASGTPVQAQLGTGAAVAIAAGDYHTCAVTTGGAVECWGLNHRYQLGTSLAVNTGCLVFSSTVRTDCRRTPIIVGINLNAVAIGVAGHRSCMVRGDGALFCWGDKFIGDGSATHTEQLTQVDAGLAFTNVVLGPRHTCGVTIGGVARCWGYNDAAQLGDGNVGSSYPTNVRPVSVFTPPPAAFHAMGLGTHHSCGIAAGREELYCWGANGDYLGFSASGVTVRTPGRVSVF